MKRIGFSRTMVIDENALKKEKILMMPASRPEYLLIGHIAHDETPAGPALGGTVCYAGGAAWAMGAPVAAVTSAHPDDPVLRQVPDYLKLHLIEADQSTIFENVYEGSVRRQTLKGRAEPLLPEHVPMGWHGVPIVHLAPLADEVDPDLVRAFPASVVAATPQGWMRTWDRKGRIHPKAWEYAEAMLPLLHVVIFSEDDIGRDGALEAHYAQLARLMVVTRAEQGCSVYVQGELRYTIPAPTVQVVDATGAGDIFAGVFLVVLHRTGIIERAARIATQLASFSITRPGIQGLPTAAEIRAMM